MISIKEKLLVSIGMPVYNCAHYIEAAITSIINQSYTNWELIIIDDGSTDDTLKKVNCFTDQRIKVINGEKNLGLAYRLNECINLSNGEFFVRMDGDDIMMIDRIAKQVRFLNSESKIDVVGAWAYLIDEKSKIFGLKKRNPPVSLSEVASTGGYFIHPTVTGRIEWFRKHFYDVNALRGEDYELWLRTFDSSNFYIMQEYLLFYREVRITYKIKYYQSYLVSKLVLTKHRDKISKYLYWNIAFKAYIKYIFYDFFKFFSLIQRFVPISVSDSALANAEFNLAIDKNKLQ